MTNLHADKMTIETLAKLLDQYGSDRSAMPAQTAAAIDELVARSSEAKELVHQAEALDTALADNKRHVDWDISSLEDSILNAAFAELPERKSASIINLSDHKAAAGKPAAGEQKQPQTLADKPSTKTATAQQPSAIKPANDNRWSTQIAASGLLAASLIFGIFFGAFGGANMLIGGQTEMTLASTDLNTVLADDIFDLGADEFSLDAPNGTSN